MRLRFAIVVAAVVAADQLTKLAVVRSLDVGESRAIVGDVLRLSHVRNSGAAFGIGRGLTGVLALAAVAGVVAFVVVLLRNPAPMAGTGAALVVGGALGNLGDRIFREWPLRGTVVDFVDFRFWPAFNVADAAITVGAGLIVLSGLRARDTENDGARPHPRR